MPRAMRVCSTPGCSAVSASAGQCGACRTAADRQRGTARQRGYGGRAWHRARAVVLKRDAWCVLCHAHRATVADHYPTSRRDLVLMHVADVDAPDRLRGLCKQCHDRHTAREAPGGWHAGE
jgi:5-methylcytosine-specific restriction protein A